MGDPIDEFMREIRRRQQAAQARRSKEARQVGADEPDDDPSKGDDDAGAGGGGGGRRARRPAGGGNRRRLPRYAIAWASVVVILFLLFFGRGLVDLWTDVMWYQSVGYAQVLWTQLGAQLGLFALGALLAMALVLGNLWLAGRLAAPPPDRGAGGLRGWLAGLSEGAPAARPGGTRPVGGVEDSPFAAALEAVEMPDLAPIGRWVLIGFGILVILGAAGGLSGAWETVLLWQNRVPYAPDGSALTDPIFHRDIGFFMFELPFLRLVQSVAIGLLIPSLLVAIGRYFLAGLVSGLAVTTQVRLHLGVLGGLILFGIAYGYQLDKLELVYSGRGFATGVSYTDANAQFLAFDLLTVLSALAAALLIGGAFTRWIWPLGATLAVWFLSSILVGGLYPEVIQRFVVEPNEFAKEQPYIANNIAMTRLAFGFSGPTGTVDPRTGAGWDDSRRYKGDSPLTQAAIDADKATFDNARLWDYRPLGDTLDQLQTIRRYYDFVDVDTDRYTIDGAERQVMLSARELDLAGNPNATGFVNQRVIFTHGMGVAMVPVNEVGSEGQPQLVIRNVPPISNGGAPEISQPRIYFGEADSSYIVVGAKQPEFDYPSGTADAAGVDIGGVNAPSWTGTTGIKLDSNLNRLLFAIRFSDLDLLISDQVTSGSQLLFHRTLSDRVPRIAPFLRYDKDPYVVISGGRLTYLWDAYTTSDRFPHSSPFSPTLLPEGTNLGSGEFNYIRNSVKVAIDAYDGTMTFYVSDPKDPIIRAWQGVFPELFKPISAMPDDLVAHIRVPEEGFNVQTRVYGRYHVTDAGTFYQNNDLWTVPERKSSDQSLPNEAYYVIMRMPGESEAEFLLLQPMVPTNRPNMIAWVAARNDGDNYGKVRVYRFPVDTTVFGPAQIEARIDQDPTISAQITLWNQSGSSVKRGNLIVVPVGDSILYLQPVYLQSTASAFPEFQRIIVASASNVVWSPTLAESLRLLLVAQGAPGASPSPGPSPTPSPTASPSGPPPSPGGGGLPSDVPGLIDYANTHFELAQAALRAGDFGRYGAEMALVQQALERLQQLVPASASPAP
jgi:uncharacterized membrane protein (UPF0182 family)